MESLRKGSVELDVKLGPGSIVPVAVDSASQVSDFPPIFNHKYNAIVFFQVIDDLMEVF